MKMLSSFGLTALRSIIIDGRERVVTPIIKERTTPSKAPFASKASAIGIVPKITDEALMNVAGVAVNMLCMLGIVVDPTTKGVKDSEQAMRYTEPRK